MQYRIASLAIVLTGLLVIPAAAHAEDAAGFVASAKAHLEKREYDKAIADCNKAIDQDFNSSEGYATRGRAWLEKANCEDAGDGYVEAYAHYGKALDDCDEALAIDANLADAYITRGNAWMRRGKFAKAVADCDKAIALDSTSARAYCTRAHIRVFTAEYDKVIADSNKAIELNAKMAEAYDHRGTAWLDTGEYDKALADCGKAIALDPTLEEAYINRGLVWAHRGNQEKAIAEYKQALKLTPNEWRVLNDMGVAHWVQAQGQEVKAAAAEAAGDQKAAKLCRQTCAVLKDQARAYWRRGIASRPTSSDILSNLGYAYTNANDLEHAEYYLKRAVEVNMGKGPPHNNYGRVLLRRSQQLETEAQGKANPADTDKVEELRAEAAEKLNAAVEQFKRAIQLDPALPEPRLNLAEVYFQHKDFEKAESQYDAILNRRSQQVRDWDENVNFSQACYGLARIAVARGKPDAAIRHLNKAIDLNPNNLAALQSLTKQRYERGEYGLGEKVLRPWLAKLPPAARQNAVEQLAKQLDDAGNHEAAEKARKAAKLPEENSPVTGKADHADK